MLQVTYVFYTTRNYVVCCIDWLHIIKTKHSNSSKNWLYLTDTNNSISRQSVTAVFAVAAIITLCSRPFIDNAGVRLHPRRMSDTPSAHSCAACRTWQNVLHSLVFRSFFLGHMWHRRRLFSTLLSHQPVMKTCQSLQWKFLIGVRIFVYADVL